MPQNKKQIKLTIILLLTTILISQFFLISLAKTGVYFSFFNNSISPALQKPEDKIISINSASQEELTSILKISEPLAQKIITLHHPTTRNNHPRRGGMERTGDNNYYLMSINIFPKKEGFYKTFVVLILIYKRIEKD